MLSIKDKQHKVKRCYKMKYVIQDVLNKNFNFNINYEAIRKQKMIISSKLYSLTNNRDFYEDDVPEGEETNNKKEEDEYNDNEFDDYNEKEENNEDSIPNVKKDEEEEEYNDKEFEDFNEESIKEENKEQDVQANNIKNNKTITYSIPPQPNPIIIQSNQHYSGFNKVNEIMKNKQNQNILLQT